MVGLAFALALLLMATCGRASLANTYIAFAPDPIQGLPTIGLMNPVDGSIAPVGPLGVSVQGAPAWAPDGSAVVAPVWWAEDRKYDLFVFPVDGSEPTRLTHDDLHERSPSWSPDGDRIAFVASDGFISTSAIYTVRVNGSGRSRLTDTSVVPRDPAWSPDGETILFVAYHDGAGHIATMTAEGGNIRELTGEGTSAWAPAWSPDGSRIAFSATSPGPRGLFVAPADGADPTQLTDSGAWPTWSPDGERIAYADRIDGRWALFTIGTDGTDATPLSPVTYTTGGPAWSPVLESTPRLSITAPGDGERFADGATSVTLAVSVGDHPTAQWRWRFDDAFPTSGPAGGMSGEADGSVTISGLSPGRAMTIHVALTDAMGDVLTPSVANRVTVFLPLPVPAADLTNTRIVYSRGELWSVNPDGTNAAELTHDGLVKRNPAYSPDGSRIAYEATTEGDPSYGHREIFVVSANGSNPVQLTAGSGSSTYPAWSPDGAYIAYITEVPEGADTRRQQVARMRPDGSEKALLTAGIPYRKAALVWSRDGSEIMYAISRWVYRMEADGSSHRQWLTDLFYDVTHMAWSPDGTRIAGTDSNLWMANSDGSRPRDLPSYGRYGVAWSPDGTRIVANGTDDGVRGLVSRAPDGSDQRLILPHEITAGVTWSPVLPPFPRIAIASPEPNAVFPAGTGSVRVNVGATNLPPGVAWHRRVNSEFPDSGSAGGVRFEDRSSFSVSTRDARFYTVRVALADAGGVLLQPLVQEERTFHVAFPVPQGDLADTRVTFVQDQLGNRDVYSIDYEGSDVRRLTFRPGEDTHARWSPDGKWIAYVAEVEGDSEIFRMRIDGSNPTRLTTNPGADTDPSWSPDGASIAFASARDGTHGVFTMNADGSNPRLIIPEASDPDWSPDGSRLAAIRVTGAGNGTTIRRTSVVSVYTRQGKLLYTLAKPLGEETVRDPRWSPDGTRMLFVGQHYIFPTLYVAFTDGSEPLSIEGTEFGVAGGAWSPDGSRVVYNFGTTVKTASSDGGDTAPLTEWGAARRYTGVHWSPFLPADDRTAPRLVVQHPLPEQRIPFASRDVALVVDIPDGVSRWAWRIDEPFPDTGPAGGVTVQNVAHTEVAGLSAGRHTIYVTLAAEDGSVLDPASTTSVTVVVESPYSALSRTKIAFMQLYDGLAVRNLDRTDFRLIDPQADPVGGISWFPDASRLCYLANMRIYSIRPDGSDRTPLLPDVTQVTGVALSPDGSKIAYVARLSEGIQLANVDGSGDAVQLTTTPGWSLTWAPDGTAIAFVASTDAGNAYKRSAIWRLYLDGSTPLAYPSPEGSTAVYDPTWSPDGTEIAFSARVGNSLQLYAMRSDGSMLRTLYVSDRTSDGGITWSPDGTRVAFADSNRTIMTVNRDGTGLTSWSATHEREAWPAWSPIPPAEDHISDMYLPAGLSLFGPPLRADTLTVNGSAMPVSNGRLMASHLIGIGATICVRATEGRFEGVIGEDGAVTHGEDFLVDGGQACIINLMEPVILQVRGKPFSSSVAPTPAVDPASVQAFLLAGTIDAGVHMPPGTTINVRHGRTGSTASVAGMGSGGFLALFVGRGAEDAIGVGDTLAIRQVTSTGYALGATQTVTVAHDDVCRANTRVAVQAMPSQTTLLPNYPNPFNPDTWIPFQLTSDAEVYIRIYDMRGILVRELAGGFRPIGYHVTRSDAVLWDGRNEQGEPVASGVYIHELQAGGTRTTGRLVISK